MLGGCQTFDHPSIQFDEPLVTFDAKYLDFGLALNCSDWQSGCLPMKYGKRIPSNKHSEIFWRLQTSKNSLAFTFKNFEFPEFIAGAYFNKIRILFQNCDPDDEEKVPGYEPRDWAK